MSLRLLPAFVMDGEEDDDGNFTNWMRSYWGHGSEGPAARERKRSFRRPARSQTDRRASLPCVSQLDAMRLSRLHAGALGASPSIHSGGRPVEENREGARPHARARRTSSDDNSRGHGAIPEGRITTIPELSESLEKRLSLGKNNHGPLKETESLCLICHEDLGSGRAGVVACTHHFHREASRRRGQGRPRSSSSAAAESKVWRGRPDEGPRRPDEGPRASEEEDRLTPHRQFSLRRHR